MAEEKSVVEESTKLSKLQRLEKRKKQIQSQILKEQNKEKTKARKADTRRKIIMGAIALSHMEKDAEFRAICERLQREGIKGDIDRALFNLEPLEEKEIIN